MNPRPESLVFSNPSIRYLWGDRPAQLALFRTRRAGDNGTDLLKNLPPDFADQVSGFLESHRVSDGGYAKSTEGAAGSTYQSFMTALTYELIGRKVPRRNALIQFLYDRQRDDGGFVEIAPMKRSGTNPTAAATALLRNFGVLDDDLSDDIIGFLTDVISAEGGFQANTRIPFADGLSTFTALLTAHDLNRRDLISPDKILAWVGSAIELPTGGFKGASWDVQADVEYTFYGLGILVCCTPAANVAFRSAKRIVSLVEQAFPPALRKRIQTDAGGYRLPLTVS